MSAFVKGVTIILVLSLIFHACKKEEVANNILSKPERQQKLVDKLTALYGPSAPSYTIQMNLEATATLIDKDGIPITKERLHGRNTNTGRLDTSPFCVDPGDPDDVGQSVTLMTIDVIYDCANGTSFRANFRVRSPFNLLVQSAASPYPYSYGRFRIRNSSNAIVYTSPNATPVTISSAIVDPTNPDRFEYMVSYTTSAMSNSTLSSGSSYEHRLQIYTDCSLQPVAIGSEVSFTANSGTSVSPCAKVDNPSLNYVFGSYPANINGCDLTSCYSSYPSAKPDGHELQWREVGQGNLDWKFTRWSDYYNSSAWVGDPSTTPQKQGALFSVEHKDIYPTNLYTNLVSAAAATGVPRTTFPADYIEFRYRNVMYSSYTSRTITCTGPWSEAKSVKVQ